MLHKGASTNRTRISRVLFEVAEKRWESETATRANKRRGKLSWRHAG